jgi:antitoxin PrlF
MEESEVTTVSAKGQVVIPRTIREKLGLKPKAKLLVYGDGDIIVMKKLHLPDMREEWKRISRVIEGRNLKYGSLTEEDVKREVEAYRKERRMK